MTWAVDLNAGRAALMAALLTDNGQQAFLCPRTHCPPRLRLPPRRRQDRRKGRLRHLVPVAAGACELLCLRCQFPRTEFVAKGSETLSFLRPSGSTDRRDLPGQTLRPSLKPLHRPASPPRHDVDSAPGGVFQCGDPFLAIFILGRASDPFLFTGVKCCLLAWGDACWFGCVVEARGPVPKAPGAPFLVMGAPTQPGERKRFLKSLISGHDCTCFLGAAGELVMRYGRMPPRALNGNSLAERPPGQ